MNWSGQADIAGQRRAIWTATARDGALTSLATGRDRREAVGAVLDALAAEPATIVGLDFAFSWPRWYLDARGLGEAEGAWEQAATLAPLASRDLPRPFWGAGIRPLREAGLDAREAYRVTEQAADAASAGARVEPSTRAATGPSASSRSAGCRSCAICWRAGAAVWPFDAPAGTAPVVAEIFPRMIARGLAPPSAGRGAAFRARVVGALPEAALGRVAGARDRTLASQDAFDAAVSAIALSRDPAAGLTAPAGEPVCREGWIWGVRPAA